MIWWELRDTAFMAKKKIGNMCKTVGLTVSDRTNVQCVFQRSLHFRRKNETANSTIDNRLVS